MRSRIRSNPATASAPTSRACAPSRSSPSCSATRALPFFAGGYVGVDVFFVISGFLITRLLLGEVDRTGGISLRRFYARRAKRLLPLSAVLLAAVGVLSLLLLSPVRAVEVSGDIVSSALYTANWHFAAQSVDYFAQDIEPSPVLHLWSLAIEEQFYLVWPTLLLAVTWFWRRRGGSVRPGALGDAGGRPRRLASRSASSSPTSSPPPPTSRPSAAPGSSALGAALALLGAVRHPPRRRRRRSAGPASARSSTPPSPSTRARRSPGPPRWLPTLGAACLILAGASVYGQAQAAPGRPALAAAGPLRRPHLLLLVPLALAGADLRRGDLGAALGRGGPRRRRRLLDPDRATHRLVEDPSASPGRSLACPNRALALGAACMAIGVCAGVAADRRCSRPWTPRRWPTSRAPRRCAEQPRPPAARRRGAAEPAARRGPTARACTTTAAWSGSAAPTRTRCLYGDPDGKRTLVLFGDSHAMQYFPALEELAEKHHWRLIALTKAECTPGEVQIRSMVADREYSQCDAWREEALRRIEMGGPLDRRGDERRHRLHPLRRATARNSWDRRPRTRWKRAMSRP